MPRELILVANPDKMIVRLDGRFEAIKSDHAGYTEQLNGILDNRGAKAETLFGETEEYLKAEANELFDKDMVVPDLSVYYRIAVEDRGIDGNPMEELAKELSNMRDSDAVEELGSLFDTAYIKPEVYLSGRGSGSSAQQMAQEYLGIAPVGIDVASVYAKPGGKGAGANIVDVEFGWNFSHYDLKGNRRKAYYPIIGLSDPDQDHENHGTAVVGILCADHDKHGIDGICPDATVYGSSVYGIDSSAKAIYRAIRKLLTNGDQGDIILIELQRPGPEAQFTGNTTGDGYIPIEWWQDDFDAIRFATLCGIIVVEAGGNGGKNLDDGIYSRKPQDFPVGWQNPLNVNNQSSGAVIVGAGNPPKDTHKTPAKQYIEEYEDRARCGFSNYGNRFDAQGWGWEVETIGVGDYQSPSNKDLWYTDDFCGTSSAAPIVVGALACIQGMLRASGKKPLSPQKARRLLHDTGSPQTGFTDKADSLKDRPLSQNIGKRPNLAEMIESPIVKNQPPLPPSPPKPKPYPKPCKPCQVTEIIIRCGSPDAVGQLKGGSSNDSSPDENTTSLVDDKRIKQIADTTGSSPEVLASQFQLEGLKKVWAEEIKKLAIKRGILKE